MYWMYLLLFVCIIFTPEVVTEGFFFFGEEDFESVLIFCFGMLGLLLYLGKESALLRTLREKLSLQKETNQIRRDLSRSYSYIGEMNRRIDIVKNMVVALPQLRTSQPRRQGRELYDPILQAIKLLSQSECVGLYFVSIPTQTILERYEAEGGDHCQMLTSLKGEQLVGPKKYLWEEGKLTFVRSPEAVEEVAAFIVFHQQKNQLEENGIFSILAAEALFVFSVYGKVEHAPIELVE